MKKMINRIKNCGESFYTKILLKAGNIISSEDGDTNFISIMVILGIVLVVAVAFIGFKDRIIGAAEGMIEDFLAIFE